MSVRIHRSADRMRIEWPLWPRLRTALGWFAVTLAWPIVGFRLASLRPLEPGATFAIALGPSLVTLVLFARPLANELSRPALVLTRAGSRIAVGSAAPLDRGAYSVTVAEARRWFGGTAHVVSFTMTVPTKRAVVELRLLRARSPVPQTARRLADDLRDFIDGR
jgi:hypothetical protein